MLFPFGLRLDPLSFLPSVSWLAAEVLALARLTPSLTALMARRPAGTGHGGIFGVL